jgi:tetratricopeptide (TPR) repeat protein
MSGCTDKRFEELLFPYELGMLNDEQRQEVELHLMGCNSCFAQIERLRHAARLMRQEDNVKEITKQYLESIGNEETYTLIDKSRSGAVRKIISLSFLIILAVAALVLKPWKIEISMDKDAIASENRVIVLPFLSPANPDDPENLCQIASGLLVTDLAESEYIQVVSSQWTDNILRIKGLEKRDSLDKTTILDIAQEANARYLITGSILEIEPQYVMAIQILATSNGDVLDSQKITGQPGEDIFSIIDRLSTKTKKVLNLPAVAYQEIDRDLNEVTTDSYQAYFYFTEGKNFMYQHRWSDAVQSFKKAIEYDSTFAMAHYYLARHLGNQDYTDKTFKYADKATRLEKYYIESLGALLNYDILSAIEIYKKIIRRYPDEIDALIQLGFLSDALKEYEQAIGYYNQILEIDPSNRITHNYISLSYDKWGNFEKAIEANDKYIQAAPDEANPYDSRGQILANYGYIDDAIAAYKKAIEIKPDFVHALVRLGHLYIFRGEYIKADSCHKLVISRGDKYFRSAAQLYRSYIPLYQGKLLSALGLITEAIQADSLIQYPEYDFTGSRHMLKLLLKAILLAEMEEFDAAISNYKLSTTLGSYDFPASVILSHNNYIDILLRSGNIEEAEREAESLRVMLEGYLSIYDSYYLAKGQIEIIKGNNRNALEYFQKINSFTYDFYFHYWKGQAFLGCQKFDEAINEFNAVLDSYTSLHLFLGTMHVKTYYYLAMAYEAKGDKDRAIENYQNLIHLWENTEYDFRELLEAKIRLSELNKK